MTIHASGSSLSASQILAEINVTSPSSGSWLSNESALRELAKKISGPVKFSDFYSKSSFQKFLDNPTTLSLASNATVTFLDLSGITSDGVDYQITEGTTSGAGSPLDFSIIDTSFTNLRVIPSPEFNISISSPPTIGSLVLQGFNNGNPFFYAGGTWMTLDSFTFLRGIWTVPAASGPASCVLQVGVRWGTNTSTQVSQLLTFEK